MQTFRVFRRWGRWTRLFGGAVFLGVGAIALMMGAVMLWHRQLWGLVPLLLGTCFFLGGWDGLVDKTYEIRLSRLGLIEFVRPLRTTRVATRDVRRIDGVMKRDSYGHPEWYMDVRHARGRIRVAHFAQATEFLALVQTHNPTVAITGLWPMPKPPHPRTRQEMDVMIRDAILARRVRAGRERR